MPELPDDDIQRMPDADRIRNRIRERREAEQSEQTGSESDPGGSTSGFIEWDSGGKRVEFFDDDTTAMKLDGAEHLDPNDPTSWKVGQVKTGDFSGDGSGLGYTENDPKHGDPWPAGDDELAHKAGEIIDPIDGDWKVGEVRSGFFADTGSRIEARPVDTADDLLDASTPYATGDDGATSDRIAGDMADGIFKFAVPDDTLDRHVKTGEFVDADTGRVVDHKADDVVAHKAGEITDPIDPNWKIEEGESLRDTAAAGQVKTGEFIDTDTDGVVDHKADDIDGPITNDPLAYEEIKVTLTDPLPDGVVDHKADDVVDHKADDVDGPITNDPFNFEEIKVTFDDPITETGIDKASPKGLPVDESADTAAPVEGSVVEGTFKFAVPTDVPGDGESFKDVSGMDEAIVPTGEAAMQQQAADPVGDALAPLDGGDQLVDPAADSADLTAQVDGMHDGDDGLDDSFGA